jgi:signal transduction histidine kinase
MSWRNVLSLSTQYLIASAIVLCVAMAVLGTWVSHQIERSVMATSGTNGAAYLRASLEQYVQRINSQGQLHPEDVAALDRLFKNTTHGERVVSVKLWFRDESTTPTIIYSSMAKGTVGEQHVSGNVEKAWMGQPVTEFKRLDSSESRYEESLQLPLIEIYAPLFRTGTQQVIAVGEIYHVGSVLAQHLRQAVILTWMIVCSTTLLMIFVLYLIVRRASMLLRDHQAILDTKVQEAEEMAAQNHALRLAADRSRLDANEANEELLGRIGLDIHDGPIQFLTLVRFRMDEIALTLPDGAASTSATRKDLKELGQKLSSVIDELRDLSVGLVLPELDALSLLQTIKLAIQRHEHLTGNRVRAKFGKIPEEVPGPLKTCVYRVVQESLSNSFKHAGGRGLQVLASSSGGMLRVTITDEGRPRSTAGVLSEGSRLGQRGIRNRIAAFNGTVSIEPQLIHGTQVSVTIPIG